MLRKRSHITALILIMIATFGVLFPSVARAQGITSFVLVPESTAIVVGNEFDVVVQIEAGENPVNSASFHLNFNPEIVEVVGFTSGEALPITIERQFDNEAGTIDYTAGAIADSFTGTADIVTIRFMAKGLGKANFVFVDSEDRDAMILAGAGVEVMGAMETASLDVVDGRANLIMMPESIVTEIGEQFTLTVEVDAAIDINRVAARLQFNPDVLQITDTEDDPVGTKFTPILTNTLEDNVNGTVLYDGSSNSFVTGRFPVFTVTFIVIAEGDVDLAFDGGITEVRSGQVNVLDQTIIANVTVGDVDDVPPVITLQGDTEIQLTVSEPFVEPGFSATDNVDGDVAVVPTGTVDTSTPGTYIITYTATDAAGNTDTATRTITVVNPPSAVQMAAEFDTNVDPSNINEGNTFIVDIRVQTSEQVTAAIGYLSFDPALLSVVSVTPGTFLPTETVSGFDNTAGTVEYGAAADGAPPQLDFTLFSVEFIALAPGAATIGFDTTSPRETVALFNTVNILAGTTDLNVGIADTTAPVITLFGESEVSIQVGTQYIDAGAGVTDNFDVSITLDPPSGSVDTDVPGTYTITYTATDAAGNTATETRTVTVFDNLAPVITLAGASPATVEAGLTVIYTDAGASAVDNVDGTVNVSFDDSTVNPAVPGTYTVTFTASDIAGNTATETRTVNVVDTTPPELILSTNVTTVEFGGTVTYPDATATDAVSGDLTDQIEASVEISTDSLGTFTRTYSVTDDAGLTDTAPFVVTVVDTTPPVITLVGENPMVIPVGDPFVDPGATAFDAVDGQVQANGGGGLSVDVNTPGVYEVSYIAADNSTNFAFATRYVYVADEVVSAFLDDFEADGDAAGRTQNVFNNYTNWLNWDITADTADLLLADVSPGVPDVEASFGALMGVNGIVVTSETFTLQPGTYGFSFDYTGSIVTSFRAAVIIEPAASPSPDNVQAQFLDSLLTPEPGMKFISGDFTIDTPQDARIIVEKLDGDTVLIDNIEVFELRQIIPDTTPPVITLNSDNPRIIAAGTTYTSLVTASDDIDGDLTGSLVVTGDAVDTSVPGLYTEIYNVSDAAGNAAETVELTVDVRDLEAPTIMLSASGPFEVAVGDDFTAPTATANDNVDGDISDQVVITGGPVDTTTPGSYTLRYNVSDNAGNAATERTVSVEVRDLTPPVITVDSEDPLIIPFGQPFTPPPAEVTDNVDTDLEAVVDNPVDVNTIGTYSVGYTAQDSAGNDALPVILTVEVRDLVPPVITIAGDNPLTVEAGTTYEEPVVTALDDVDGDVTANITPVGTVDPNVPGIYMVTYNVSDAAGNPAEAMLEVVVEDTTPPVLTLDGGTEIAIEAGDSFTIPTATAVDSLEGDISNRVQRIGTVDPNTPGVYTVTYDVSDTAGNAAPTLTLTVTVGDTTPPVIMVEGSTEITLAVGDTYTPPTVTAVDNVDGDISGDIVPTGTVDTAIAGVYTVEYNVADAAGNAALPVTVTVTVEGDIVINQPPIAVAGDDITITDEDNDGVETITLDGTGSSDPDGTIVNYAWLNGSDVIDTQPTWTGQLPVGTYNITLTVVDDGNASDTDVIVVTILEGDVDPSETPTPDPSETPTPTPTLPPVIVELQDFAIFGLDAVTLRNGAQVESGNVGTNDYLLVDVGASVPSMDSAVFADLLDIRNQGVVSNAFYNELSNQGEITGVQGSVEQPIVPGLPPFPDVQPGITDVNVAAASVVLLRPGNYDDLIVQRGATVVLEPGTYNFGSWIINHGVNIIFEGPTQIGIEGSLRVGRDAYIGPAIADQPTEDVIIYVGGEGENAALIGSDAVFIGNIAVPSGNIRFNQNAEIIGRVAGEEVMIGANSTVSLDGPYEGEIPTSDPEIIITPEVTPEITEEPTEEVTPDVTPEPTEEVTPEITEEPTEEVTPDVTPEVTPEPTEEVTPEVTPEPTEEVTPDVTPEVTPDVTEEPLAVIGFTLIDASTDAAIGSLTDGAVLNIADGSLPTEINIRADVIGTPGSVRFSGLSFSHENTAPFSAFGDDNGDFAGYAIPAGDYTLMATPYSGPELTGEVGTSYQIAFRVVDDVEEPVTVSGFTLIDPLTDTAIMPLTAGTVLNVGDDSLPAELNIRADVIGTPGSVELIGIGYRSEDVAPFSIFGDIRGDFMGGTIAPGTYTLRAIPYSGSGRTGTQGAEVTVTFTVVDEAPPLSINALEESDTLQVEIIEPEQPVVEEASDGNGESVPSVTDSDTAEVTPEPTEPPVVEAVEEVATVEVAAPSSD